MWMASFCRCFAFAHKCTAIFCNADWTQMAAAVPAEWTVPLSRIRCWVLCWGFFFFYAAFNFILTRVRGEIFFQDNCAGLWCSWPPCGWRTSLAEASAAPCSWRCVLEKPWLQIALHRRPRAKVGGCVKAPAALISSAGHRLSFVRKEIPSKFIR